MATPGECADGQGLATLSPLQLQMCKSLFGGRLKLQSGTEAEFIRECESKWSMPPVVHAINHFLAENHSGSIPKMKGDRARLFFQKLLALR